MSRSLAEAVDELSAGFLDPPDDARPMVYWVWLNGNVTREGITLDLEAMARIGIGEVLLMNGTVQTPPSSALYLTEEWLGLLAFALTELRRLGLRMSLFSCDGFSLCGGPAVTPELAMRKLSWAETVVAGPRRLVLDLPALPGDDPYDLCVLAALIPEHDTATELLGPRVELRVPPSYEVDQVVDLDVAATVSGRSLILTAAGDEYHVNLDRPDGYAELSVSSDGAEYRPVASFRVDTKRMPYPVSTVTCSFPPLSARHLRLRFVRSAGMTLRGIRLLTEGQVDGWELKAGLAQVTQHGGGHRSTGFSTDRAEGTAPRTPSTIDLTASTVDGRLTWSVPHGHWRVLRVGQVATGKQNHPATRTGQGLECDKLSPYGVETVLTSTIDRILDRLGPELRSTLRAVHSDSYECGPANWTPQWRTEFTRRRGYDPQPWLPVLTSGVTFGDEHTAERFLWDHRRTLSELYAENYLRRHWQLAADRGLEFQSESCGRQQYMYDPITYLAQCDVPMGEFWLGPPPYEGVRADCRAAASAAHVHGRNRVAAEAFTALGPYSRYTETPANLKRLGDQALCTGINQFVIHRSVHQPWPDLAPGLAFGPYGIHFERTNTWWDQSAAWMSYLTRCQWLLRQGRPVADVLFFVGDDVPNHIGPRGPEWLPVPAGLDFDACDLPVLVAATVVDGRIQLPSGTRYRYLLLPDARALRPQTMAQIERLVGEGATVVGRPPSFSPSLEGFPGCDTQVVEAATRVWGPCDGGRVTEHRLGRGRVIWGPTWSQILSGDHLPLDVDAPPGATFCHRSLNESELYFVANGTDHELTGPWTFRVDGLLPELWDPDTGAQHPIAGWARTPAGVEIALTLPVDGSCFVVFRPAPAEPTPRPVAGRETPDELVDRVDGPWTVTISDQGRPVTLKLEALVPLNRLPDPRARCFSGTAVYRTTLSAPAADPTGRLVLDLGQVATIAEVRLGAIRRTLWHPPYRLDITDALHGAPTGAPVELELAVTTTWVNRLIGDEAEPDDASWGSGLDSPDSAGVGIADWPAWLTAGRPRPSGRQTFTAWKHYSAEEPLVDSGLIGPVTLHRTTKIIF